MATNADELLQLKSLLDNGVITEEEYNQKKMNIIMGAQSTYVANQQEYATSDSAKSKTIAGILGIVLGWLGAHKFYLGYTKEGFIMLACTIVGMFLIFPTIIVAIIGVVEGIIYLTKDENTFQSTYVQGHKGWF